MLALLGDAQKIKELFILRKQKYNWKSNNIIKIKRITNTRITDFIITAEEGGEELKDNATYASNGIEELDDTIAEYLAKEISSKDIQDHALLDTEIGSFKNILTSFPGVAGMLANQFAKSCL